MESIAAVFFTAAFYGIINVEVITNELLFTY